MPVLSRPYANYLIKGLQIAVFLSLFYLWAGTAAAEKIDINTASLEQLETLAGIGPVKAQTIIDTRPFFSVDDLIKVKGIGEKTLQKIKDQALAYVENQIQGAQTATKPLLVIYPEGIRINEILPSPEGPDETEEWIEIFNRNDFEVNLSGWKIEDTTGKTTIYVFEEGMKIAALGFLILPRPTTKITLNNDGDGLNLIQPDGKIINSVTYEKAPRGQSYNYQEAGWFWSSNLTPGSANIIPAQKTEEAKILEKAGKIDINTAPLKDLIKITHIGKVRAEELISLRPFYSLDDLTRIKGIGDKTLEDIKKQELAWVDLTLESPKIEKTEFFEKGLTATAEPFFPSIRNEKSLEFFSLLPIASVLAVSSGISILVLKRKLKKI